MGRVRYVRFSYRSFPFNPNFQSGLIFSSISLSESNPAGALSLSLILTTYSGLEPVRTFVGSSAVLMASINGFSSGGGAI